MANYSTTLDFIDVTSEGSTLSGRIIFIDDGDLFLFSEQFVHLNFVNTDALKSSRTLNYSSAELISFEADIALTTEYIETVEVIASDIQ